MNNFQGLLNKALVERLVETEDWIHLNGCGVDFMENIHISSDFDYVDKALSVSRYTRSMKLLDENGATKKSNAKSARMREKANESFKKKKWLEALKLYSRSAAFAENGSLELCFAYGNRSALLFHRGYYKECLEDIERALQMEYPEDKKPQLISRQQKAKELLPNQTKKIVPDVTPSLPSCNSILKTATDAVKLTENEEYGRFIEATKDIRPGEIIVIENPYAIIVTQDCKSTNCGDCGKLCYNLIPCSRCCVEMYCSDKCKTNAYNAYHRYECIIMNFYPTEAFDIDAPARDANQLDTEIIRQLSLRITLKGFRNYMNIPQSVQLEDLYQEVAKLQTHHNELSKSSKMLLAINCAKQFYTIKKYTDFLSKLQFKNKEDILKYHLLRNRLICCFNLSHLLFRTNGMHDEIHVGYGLYPTYSMFNHSCVENVGYGFYGKTIVMRAKRTIRKGEQCFINYGYFYQLLPKTARCHKLQCGYFFSCKCEACANNWPIFNEVSENNPDLKSPALMKLEFLKALYSHEKYPTEELKETVFKTCAEFENMKGPGIHLVSYYHLINIAMLTRYQGGDF